MAKEILPYVLHIYDAIKQIEIYLEDYSFEKFESDRKTQDAVVRQFEIIGEAASKLENQFKIENSEIPWREITDFRNVLAHEYWDIDIDIVWKTATVELKDLKKALTKIVESKLP